jgi:hypothetical protein
MKKLLSLLLLAPALCWGQTYPNPTFLAPSGGTARAMQSHFSDVVNLLDYGADPTGVADSSTALAAAIAQVNTNYGLSTPVLKCIYVPAGSYYINNATVIPKFNPGVPGCVGGDGVHKSTFTLGTSFAGDLFATSEAWDTAYTNGMNGTADKAGPYFHDFSVFGNTSASSQQNLLRLYDRNDFVTIANIEVHYLNGQCFSVGRTLNQIQAYMREFQISNFRCFNAGTSTQPVFEFSTTSPSGADATNTGYVSNLQVYASAGRAIVLNNPTSGATSGVRYINFYNVRAESCGGDCFTIGLATDSGSINNIGVYGYISPGCNPAGCYDLVVSPGASPTTGYDISLHGLTLQGAQNGINLARGTQIAVGLQGMAVSGTYINVSSAYNITYLNEGLGFIPAITSSQTFSTPLANYTPAYYWGNPVGNPPKAGLFQMFGSGSGSSFRLTMDGTTASATNTFNLGYSTSVGFSGVVNCQDMTTSSKTYTWAIPVGYYANYSGAGTAYVSLGTPATTTNGTVTGAGVALTADATNGGINITFTTPTSNTDTWQCAANFMFAKAP